MSPSMAHPPGLEVLGARRVKISRALAIATGDTNCLTAAHMSLHE